MKAQSILRRGATVLAAAVLTTAGLFTGTASASPASSAGVLLKCGYDTDFFKVFAYYTHCDPQTYVVIKIKGSVFAESERCVGPGETKLGLVENYQFAYYAGKLC